MQVKVKICGLTTPEAVDAAVKGGASHVGFVFSREPVAGQGSLEQNEPPQPRPTHDRIIRLDDAIC
jgi:hypothetical protein